MSGAGELRVHAAAYAEGQSRAASGGFPPPGAIRAVLFQAENVLFDTTAWKRRLWQVARRLGVALLYSDFAAALDQRHLPKILGRQETLTAGLRRFLNEIGLSEGEADELATVAAARYMQELNSARPLPGVVSALAALSAAGLSLGVICECENVRDVLQRWHDELAVAHRLQSVVQPPHRDMAAAPLELARASEEIGAPPAQTLYVSRCPQRLEQARRAGLWPLACGHQPRAADVPHVERLRQLPSLVAADTPLAKAG